MGICELRERKCVFIHFIVRKQITLKKNDRRSSGGTLRQTRYLTFNQWTNGPMDQWTNGPMDQWTNGPMDQWTNGHSTFSCDINCIDTVMRLRVT